MGTVWTVLVSRSYSKAQFKLYNTKQYHVTVCLIRVCNQVIAQNE